MSAFNYKYYFCETCNYKTTRKDSFKKHIDSIKHIINCDKTNSNIKPILEKKYKCSNCNKIYSHRQSMHRHKLKCDLHTNKKQETNIITIIDNNKSAQLEKNSLPSDNDDYKEIIKSLIEQNNNLQGVIKDMIPKIGSNNTIINNNKVNMMLFLEQQCKSAPTMKDYIAGLKIQVSDLLHTKDKGIVNGITNIFLNNLRQLDIYERPIHCTDMKRQILYIKEDDNTWLQGEESRKIISNAIQDIQAKHTKTIPEWEKMHPDWPESEHLTEDYMRIVKYSTQFIDENSNDENKIIRAIAKEVILDKKYLQIE